MAFNWKELVRKEKKFTETLQSLEESNLLLAVGTSVNNVFTGLFGGKKGRISDYNRLPISWPIGQLFDDF